MAKGKAAKTGDREKTGARNKIGRAWGKEASKIERIDKLNGPARGAAEGDRRKAVSDIQNIISLGKGGNMSDDIASINRSGGSLRDIANQVVKDREAKAKSDGPKSSRSDAVKRAWQTRKKNGTK